MPRFEYQEACQTTNERGEAKGCKFQTGRQERQTTRCKALFEETCCAASQESRRPTQSGPDPPISNCIPAWPPPTHPVRVWTVASDCSGLCTEGLASKLAFGATQEVKVIHKYASEVCPKKRPVISLKQFGNNCHVKVSRTWHQCPCARKFIQEAIGPDYLHHDMTTSGSLPTALWEDCDLYAVGFPCQSFSLAGKKQGVQDPGVS